MNITLAKSLFKENFIGPDELKAARKFIEFKIPSQIPRIDINLNNVNYTNSILILGVEKINDGSSLNIQKLVSLFGYKSTLDHPNFYNQDWYLNEKFTKKTISLKWYLIEKKVRDISRGVKPKIGDEEFLPSAILCTYVFFLFWFNTNKILWENDFVWCSDKDSFGDRIYIGKYKDKIDSNRSGFSIHRHLELKKNYGSIKFSI